MGGWTDVPPNKKAFRNLVFVSNFTGISNHDLAGYLGESLEHITYYFENHEQQLTQADMCALVDHMVDVNLSYNRERRVPPSSYPFELSFLVGDGNSPNPKTISIPCIYTGWWNEFLCKNEVLLCITLINHVQFL